MKFRIHFTACGHEDSVELAGDTIQELRDRAHRFMVQRGIDESTCWSERLEE